MSKFGWSYPAGCNGPPDDDYPEMPCVLCGKVIDNCTCPPCTCCGDQGCMTHMGYDELSEMLHLREYQVAELKREIDKHKSKRL